MNPDPNRVDADNVNADIGYAGVDPQTTASPNPLLSLHRLLQGRYPYAIVLAIVGAALCGLAGYILPEPIYRSIGMVRYKPVLPRVLYQSEESSVMPMFDAYVVSQAQLLKSQRVLDMAMQDEAWRSHKIVFTTDKQAEFRDNLEVKKEKKSTIVSVSFTDPDPGLARTAVKTVINAYTRIYGENDNVGEANRLQLLEQRRVALTNQVASIRSRILDLANEFGSDALDQMYEFKLEQLNGLEQALAEVGITLASAGISVAEIQSDDDSSSEDLPTSLAVEEIGARDKHMRQLLDHRTVLEQELKLMQVRLGDNHRNVVELRTKLDLHDQSIETYANTYRDSAIFPETGEWSSGGTDVGQLRRRANSLQALYDQAKAELLDLGRKKLQIDNLKVEEETIQQRLEETKFRIEQINLESSFGGRVDVLSTGDKPLVPHKDKRTQFAILGSGAGAVMGICPLILLGLVSRRLRSCDDARYNASHIKLLGVLPSLADSLSDNEQTVITGYCIHHIRTMLQLGSGQVNRQVIAVTSPSTQAGKTSLTLALGLSYAASGSKTLLIDCDLAGGGLTSRLETTVRRRVGAVLRRRSLITKEQLNQALGVAAELRQRLGKTLVELGFLSKEELTHALAAQKNESVGLLDAITEDELGACIAKTGIARLDILPVGEAAAHDVSRISPDSLRRVVEAARGKYDMVLIDTGPIGGGAETSIAACVADEVVVVVARGDQEREVQHALKILDKIGAHVDGFVFNRANARDIARSMMSSSLRSNPSNNDNKNDEVVISPTTFRSERFGPVAQAVARTLQTRRSNGNGEFSHKHSVTAAVGE